MPAAIAMWSGPFVIISERGSISKRTAMTLALCNSVSNRIVRPIWKIRMPCTGGAHALDLLAVDVLDRLGIEFRQCAEIGNKDRQHLRQEAHDTENSSTSTPGRSSMIGLLTGMVTQAAGFVLAAGQADADYWNPATGDGSGGCPMIG